MGMRARRSRASLTPKLWRDLTIPAEVSLVSHLVLRRTLAQLIESRLESAREFFGRAPAPVVQEDDNGPVSRHVVMNRHYVETALSERFQNRRHFAFEHRDVTRNCGIFLRADERCPCVQTHASVDHCSVLLHSQVVSSHGDLVNRSRLLAFVACDLGKLGRVERSAAGARRSSRFGFYV